MDRIARIGRILATLALITGAAGCGTSGSSLRAVERPPEVDIRGHIQTPGGPAVRAFVVLKPRGNLFQAYTFWTLSDGTFEGRGLPPGEYDVQISLDGFLPVRERRNFIEGGGRIEVMLQPLGFQGSPPGARGGY